LSRTFLVALALLLVGCGEVPRPFAPEFKGETNRLLMPLDHAGVVVRTVDGLPDGTDFTAALAESLRREGIAAMTGSGNAASLVLHGTAARDGEGWLVELSLDDPRGTALGIVATWLPVGPLDGHIRHVARSVAAVVNPDGPVAVARKPVVAVGAVAGVPGEGGRALARALEFNLRRANVDLADPPEKATHFVTATVNIAAPRGQPGKELRHVDVRWTVRAADQREIGEVRQANDVPARELDRNWSEIAYLVADAAVEGIADLLTRPPPR
jgi:hypothetical protein